ncbi:hypothetical protein [Streptomyces sp. V2I9]|uniref:hypothetical protein n=1 Tax=Streptomyces sp. V2I9 TaxID=3042304 RepID=UPI0027810350|nr:hypothetical protein [Streptomyces sp. V2I9]MDQ0985230.1 hypothetical protein [Streptomyces sp. V2I9]
MSGRKPDVGCLAVGVVFLPVGLGLGYVLVMAAWRIGHFLWSTGGPRLAEGDPTAWAAAGVILFLLAVVAFIYWDAGRDGGPSPRPGRAVHQGEDWYWQVEDPPKPRRDGSRGPSSL